MPWLVIGMRRGRVRVSTPPPPPRAMSPIPRPPNEQREPVDHRPSGESGSRAGSSGANEGRQGADRVQHPTSSTPKAKQFGQSSRREPPCHKIVAISTPQFVDFGVIAWVQVGRTGVCDRIVSTARMSASRGRRRRSIRRRACVRDPSLRRRRLPASPSITTQFDETTTRFHVEQLPFPPVPSGLTPLAREVHDLCICAMQNAPPL